MDVNVDDWKAKVGIPINYESGQSSDDDFDIKDVVYRNPQSSSHLLADGGDGSEADLLGTTPPRSRIRDKMKRSFKSYMDPGFGVQRASREKRDVVDHASVPDATPERLRKRSSLKLIRSKERDWKLDMSHQNKADSLPSPNPVPAVPTLVESCSRFMSLTSRPKCRETIEIEESEPEEQLHYEQNDHMPSNRASFHKTFCLLINMGNVEKGCRRTISREEQVWQNELKDLIWLELQAKIAGRTLAQQDAYLCTQRKIVPTVVNNILEYKFINTNPCRGEKKTNENGEVSDDASESNEEYGCLRFDCQLCSDAVGNAMREVCAIIDAYYEAVSLYPSTNAMIVDHPQVATPLFKNRLKAMCLWFNTALNMRLKMLAVQRLLRSMKLRSQNDRRQQASNDLEAKQPESESHRVCQVQFNVSGDPTPTGSNNSDSSGKDDEFKEAVEKTNEDSCDDSAKPESQPETPEVVIDSRFSSNNTADTSESGYTSAAETPTTDPTGALDCDAFNVGVLDELTQLRLLGKCSVSLYREYHQEILKTQGVRRCMMFINKLQKGILCKVHFTIEKPDTKDSNNELEEPIEESKDQKDNVRKAQDGQYDRTYELRRYGCWSQECIDMKLPSFRAHFLLLNAICLEAMHDYLTLRLDTAPDTPSCLTVKQLIHELKEGLDMATEMRIEFVRSATSALAGRSTPAPHLLRVIRTFDDTIETMLKLYLSFLTTMSVKEPIPRGVLQSEWAFTAKLAGRVRCAHILAPQAYTTIACNQLKRLTKQFADDFENLKPDDDEKADADRHVIYAMSRKAHSIYARSRGLATATAAWARGLAAKLAKATPHRHLEQRRQILEALMELRNLVVYQVEKILERSDPSLYEEGEFHEILLTRIRELLLQISKLGFELHRELYQFACGPLPGAAPGARPASLQPPPRRAPRAPRPRPGTVFIQTTNPILHDLGIHKELHQLVHEGGAGRPAFPGRAPRAPPRGRALMRSDSVLEDVDGHIFDDKLLESDIQFGDNQTHASFELLLSGGQPTEDKVELRREECRVSAEEQQWAARVARAVIEYAKCWMKFVLERCDRGRGLRPRWASQGLEFLMLACDPCNTKHLTDEEFAELEKLMDGCITHVIGSRPSADTAMPSPRPRHRLHSPLPSNPNSACVKDSLSPPTLISDADPMQSIDCVDANGRSERVCRALQEVEQSRENKLREAGRVGRVLTARAPTYRHKLRTLSFKWQRGLKIGAGSFGKVYTVVNTESGQLLAMKELSIGAADRRAFQRAANELQVLEGVIHPHLVRYYGCELHREEMLIFMELCVEGSLEALIATNGALQEPTVRRYTKQLLSAVFALHSRSIAHRDIKSGNIFLTNDGHCLKLGDFGCAVKIRANTTAPNELQGFVGTQAYMAPEVFMKSSGHGRAADIWSVGCVVTEMASGKRPFSEYDSNYQIMFMVGMGTRPTIPGSLSEEGHQFCELCLTHDPDKRPRANELMLHTFLMVKSDDDCKCEPAYLIT